MAEDVIRVAELIDHRRQLEVERANLKARMERIDIEVDVVSRLIHAHAPRYQTGQPTLKYGPADAVRKLVTDNRHIGLTRKEILDRGATIVTTPPAKARKVLDQTVRNLTDKSIHEVQGRFFPIESVAGSTNGHQE